jgi:hypothetical protein
VASAHTLVCDLAAVAGAVFIGALNMARVAVLPKEAPAAPSAGGAQSRSQSPNTTTPLISNFWFQLVRQQIPLGESSAVGVKRYCMCLDSRFPYWSKEGTARCLLMLLTEAPASSLLHIEVKMALMGFIGTRSEHGAEDAAGVIVD